MKKNLIHHNPMSLNSRSWRNIWTNTINYKEKNLIWSVRNREKLGGLINYFDSNSKIDIKYDKYKYYCSKSSKIEFKVIITKFISNLANLLPPGAWKRSFEPQVVPNYDSS